jgi:glycosyltransferase involved in cell wall biosynthesis
MSPIGFTPLISIVVAVYNGVATLQQCIDSVASQSFQEVQLIIIDGGSTDGTVDLLKANAAKLGYWISEPDKGIYNAWNKALRHANGEWICFLGADDYLWEINVLKRMASHLVLLPAHNRVAYGQIMLLTIEGVELHAVGQPWGEVKHRFAEGVCLPHPAVMHRRVLFEEQGEFDETYRIAGDYELLLRELKNYDAVYIPGIVLTAMRQGGISSDPKNILLSLREVRRAQRKHGQLWPGLHWQLALARAYIRLLLWRLFGERVARQLLDVGRKWMGLPAYWTKT